MTTVKSSNIKALEYDPKTNDLTIVFNSGGTYIYHEVSADEHDALLVAESVGKHFHATIKTKKFTKV